MTEPDFGAQAGRILDAVPYLLVADGVITQVSSAVTEEVAPDAPSLVGQKLDGLGTRLDNTTVDELLDGSAPLRLRLGASMLDRPVRLRLLGESQEGSVVEIRSLAAEFRLESLLRRSDYGHMLISPAIELEWSMTSNDLASIFPGDNPMEWVELMDPDDMEVLGGAILEVGADPNASRVVRHRLNADRTYSIVDSVESALHDPDLRAVLVRSRLEDDVVGDTPNAPAASSFAGIAVSDHMPLGVIMASATGNILHRNAVAADLVGARSGRRIIPGKAGWLLESIDASAATTFGLVFEAAAKGGSGHCTIPSPVAEGRWLRVSMSPAAASTVVLVVEDTTDLVLAEEALRASNRLMEALDAHSEELVLVFDAEGQPRYLSSSIERMVGPAFNVSAATDVFDFVHADDRSVITDVYEQVTGKPGASAVISIRVLDGEGGARWHQGRVSNLLEEEGVEGLVWTLRDVHERHLAELDLEYRATHDELTTLPERAAIQARLELALELDRATGRHTALVFCDIDNFKLINDSVGHGVGDLVLTEVASRLSSSVREIDVVGRFGGDEFVIVAPGLDSETEAQKLAERVFTEVCGRAHCGGVAVELSVSMGVALSSPDADSAEILMQRADTAMYAAKRAGRGRVEVFSTHMGEGLSERLQMQGELVDAIAADELVLHYQPIVATGATPGLGRGVESLARWHHPRRGLLSANAFIEVAEESGMMVNLGHALLELVCRDTAQTLTDTDGFVCINLSPSELGHSSAADDFLARLEAYGIAPSQIVIELTEASLARGATCLANLERFRAAGVRIFLDDFGTGYSSLSQLRRFPVDGVKIDRTFVDPEVDEHLVRLIVGVAQTMGIRTIAEGVETNEQLEQLTRLGVDYAQGYLLGRPSEDHRQHLR